MILAAPAMPATLNNAAAGAIDGIGPAEAEALAAGGVFSALCIVGNYLKAGGDEATFTQWLADRARAGDLVLDNAKRSRVYRFCKAYSAERIGV